MIWVATMWGYGRVVIRFIRGGVGVVPIDMDGVGTTVAIPIREGVTTQS
jgi:hypothetical protein